MVTPHHASSGLAARLVELGADSVFVDCEHGTWSFEDVRMTAQIVRAVGGAAIVRPQSHERPLIIRYLNAGADGIMVPMVGTAAEARAQFRSVHRRFSFGRSGVSVGAPTQRAVSISAA
ncbi:aldolase/citrate lyase family protein, partial [Agrobacterium tumefaciens]|uniref:aldolase/citrate lyase family protein n=1 Tax=Agrobacterium tumefaciens TaxID=358 RepID=UPI001EEF1CF1